jgi:transmembrane sensor
MKHDQPINELIEKYRAGTISDEEKAILESWYNMEAAARSADLSEQEVQESLGKISRRLMIKPERTWLKAAAAILLLLAGGTVYYSLNKQVVNKKPVIAEIQPGGTKATLQLASGKKIELNGQKAGIVVNGQQVVYNDGKQVEGAVNGAQLQYMQLSTPKGGQYQITLPDGTQAWLNSASKLTYPDRFENAERVVELDGEAYFSVSKSDKPFIVKSRGQEVQVLGTTFNIMAYNDEPYLITTLVSGAVKVNGSVLKPGFAAHVSASGLTITEADLKAATAWKDGLFYFSNADLRSVMNQLKRWYDIDIEYQTDRKGDEFMGQIPRDKPLDNVLEILRLSGIRFRMEGRKLIVY